VNDAEGVRLRDRLAGLEQVVHRVRDGQGAALPHDPREVVAVQVLHDHVRGACRELTNIQHTGDVIALQAYGRPGLALEALHRLGARGAQEELDGDPLPQAEVLGRHDHTHAAAAEDALDAVLTGKDLPFGHGNGRRVGRGAHASPAGGGPSTRRDSSLTTLVRPWYAIRARR
jgi:hypothetical protein